MKNALVLFVLASLSKAGFADPTLTNGRAFREVIIRSEPDQMVSLTLSTSFETDDSCNTFSLEGPLQTTSAGKFVVADLYVSQTKMACRNFVAPYKKTVGKPLEVIISASGTSRLLLPKEIDVAVTR